jgi:hypothetical protein
MQTADQPKARRLRTWVEQQEDRQREQDELAAARQRADEQTRRSKYTLRLTPMDERLKRLIELIPEDERDEPRHINYFCTALKAKFPTRGDGFAAQSEVGPALSRLGWRRQRKWDPENYTYTTMWIPPEAQEQ